MVRIDEYPNLALLCWNLEAPYVTRRDAFSLYERNWRLVDRDAAPEHERAFIDDLATEFGRGLINAAPSPMAASSSEIRFHRPWHRLVWQVLESLNSDLLSSAKCYFGGGTRIALALGEFRESVDVDFLCSDRDGYRSLRSAVTSSSLGEICSGRYDLMREVRTDMYGIRTFLRVDERPVKFEILSEGRISLAGETVDPFPVKVLDRTSCIAEKLLAHADRGGDESTHARDLIDLAFMAGSWPAEHLRAARAIAESAYGSVVMRELGEGLSRFEDASRRRHCIEMLSIADTSTLDRGLLALKKS